MYMSCSSTYTLGLSLNSCVPSLHIACLELVTLAFKLLVELARHDFSSHLCTSSSPCKNVLTDRVMIFSIQGFTQMSLLSKTFLRLPIWNMYPFYIQNFHFTFFCNNYYHSFTAVSLIYLIYVSLLQSISIMRVESFVYVIQYYMLNAEMVLET